MNQVVFRRARLCMALSLVGALGVMPIVAPHIAWAQELRLGADDVLAVSVANHPEMSVPELPVGSNGKIALPLVGDLAVAGKTLAQVQAAITAAMKSQLLQPQVTVSLVRGRVRQVIMLGAVTRPGPVEIRPGWRVSEAMAAVGGPSQAVEDLTATLTRGKATPVPLDLPQIVASPQSAANLRLNTGDLINVVPVAITRVAVTGDVGTPNSFTLRRNPHVLDAIRAAGGLKSAPETVKGTVLRAGGAKMTLDVPAIFQNTAGTANLVLQDGDLLTFETIHTNISVVSLDNLVKTPGNYQLGSDATALRAIVQAGGLNAPVGNVVASVRRGSDILPVDLVQAAYNPSKDTPLHEGDVLLVALPEGPQITVTGAVAQPGPRRVREGTALLDAIIQAGGLTSKPDQVRLQILRTVAANRQIVLNIDPVALFDLRDLGQNVRLQQGDVVVVNEGAASQTVFVSGEVKTPGALDIGPKDSLPAVITRAGGPTPFASLSSVTVTHRDGTVQTIDVKDAMQGGSKLDFPLSQGDMIFVARNTQQVLVTNAVNVPGYYAIPEKGLTLGDAILAAGGTRPDAKTKEVTVLHRTTNGVEQKTVALDAVQNGVLNRDLLLRPNDVIFVPESQRKTSALSTVGQTLSSVSLLLRLGGIF